MVVLQSRRRYDAAMSASLSRLPKHFGETVRELRKEAELSQMVLAEKAGLTLNYIGNVERGEKMPSLETVIRIASAFGMSGAQLLAKAQI